MKNITKYSKVFLLLVALYFLASKLVMGKGARK